jgi:hypothetical protein
MDDSQSHYHLVKENAAAHKRTAYLAADITTTIMKTYRINSGS